MILFVQCHCVYFSGGQLCWAFACSGSLSYFIFLLLHWCLTALHRLANKLMMMMMTMTMTMTMLLMSAFETLYLDKCRA